MKPIEHHIYVIFGATGDLTKRKLLPAIFSLYMQKLLPERFIILGASRSVQTREDFVKQVQSSLHQFSEIQDDPGLKSFLTHVDYISMDFQQSNAYSRLREKLNILQKSHNIPANIIFYLAVPPQLYDTIPPHLAKMGLNQEEDGWKRLIIEKPFGFNLNSAIELKKKLLCDWKEEQIYRIDHYLGKETVQNLLVTRFSNGIFEPLWNRNYINHVEITSAESIGVENRGGYYESSGALRDMVQNHLLQVAALVAMEPPSSLDASVIRYEILKVFQSLRPFTPEDVRHNVIRAQYTASKIQGNPIPGYRDENGVAKDSHTETYVALKFYIDNWRWGGVPFYIRTGKRLPTRVTEVVIHFKPTPHALFASDSSCRSCNQLVIRIQPDEGILLKFDVKVPGKGMKVQNVNMDFHYSDLSNQRIPPAYERLIYDTMIGDSTLFARTEEVLLAWKFLNPILELWENDPTIPLYGYPAGTWGPDHADDLIEEPDMTWRYPCKNLADDGIFCEL
jgi:glucose-6-phosphate 1-dehydrogenase